MGWNRGEILGKGGFAFVSKAKTHQESSHEIRYLPPVIAMKLAKVSESKPLLEACPCILCLGVWLHRLVYVNVKVPWKFFKKGQAKDALFKIGCSNEIPEIPTNKKITGEAKDFIKKCLVKDLYARWRVDMLLDHPFLKMAVPEKYSSHHHHHHRVSSRFHSMMPHCFHVQNSGVVHAC